MKRYKIGYTQGTFDMCHKGHVMLLQNAKERCEILVVGVNSDELVMQYKAKVPVICEEDRKLMVESLKMVDYCIIVDTLDKSMMLDQIPFEVIFIGDEWQGNERWSNTESVLATRDVDVIYLPHTDGVSSTELRERIGDRVEEWG